MAPNHKNPISPRITEVFYQSPPIDPFGSSYSSQEEVTVLFWNDQQWCDQIGQTGNTIAAGQVSGATQEQANENARLLLGCSGPIIEVELEELD